MDEFYKSERDASDENRNYFKTVGGCVAVSMEAYYHIHNFFPSMNPEYTLCGYLQHPDVNILSTWKNELLIKSENELSSEMKSFAHCGCGEGDDRSSIDRKSTRLNSSHRR